MAPEHNTGGSNSKLDIYSIGAITYWLLTRTQYKTSVNQNEVHLDAEATSQLSAPCIEFLQKSLAADNKRASCDQLLDHPFLKQ
jgi:serine/threonine protein kinase